MFTVKQREAFPVSGDQIRLILQPWLKWDGGGIITAAAASQRDLHKVLETMVQEASSL